MSISRRISNETRLMGKSFVCLWTSIHRYPHVLHECNDRWSFLKRRTFLSQKGSKLLKMKWPEFIPRQQAVTIMRQKSLFQAVQIKKMGQCWKLKILPRVISNSGWRRNKPFKSNITKQANDKKNSRQIGEERIRRNCAWKGKLLIEPKKEHYASLV